MKTGIRPLWKDILTAAWLGLILPGITLQICVFLQRVQPETEQEIPVQQEDMSRKVILRNSASGNSEAVPIDRYLTGVVLAEMPAFFAMDALKAQAVAARTYTMKASTGGGKHGDGSLCDDPGCCQGYLPEDAFLMGGGTPELLDKVRKAVEDTAPLVLKHRGELIEAVYFSSSGGRTESALAVWGADYPYLQSVESPGEGASAYHNRTRMFSLSVFQALLGVRLSGEPDAWFSDVTYTEGGGVERMTIGGTLFTGVQLRSLLNLPSTAFSVTAEGENVVITSGGYGHRVGMSQYGADAMADAGYSFEEILAHYYPGTVLISME